MPRVWFFLGVGSVGAATLMYGAIYWWFHASFLGLPRRDKIAHLISHVPDDNSPAWPHIFAGVVFCLGMCFLAGVAVVSLPFVSVDLNKHSTALTASSLVFGVLISTVSFWTLWQTKRIEQLQGSNISGFRDLIIAISREIEFLNRDFRESNNFKGREYHRVFLVTTNPFFGQLSFPGDNESTDKFADAMRHAAENVHYSSGQPDDERFRVEILCGSKEAITGFHQYFYRQRGAQKAESTDPRVHKATNATENFVGALQMAADPSGKNKPTIVHRAVKIPQLQFAIIGNVVFEFILDTPGYQSEIHRARRIREKVLCDRFQQTFDLLREHFVGDSPEPKQLEGQQLG